MSRLYNVDICIVYMYFICLLVDYINSLVNIQVVADGEEEHVRLCVCLFRM